MGPGGAGGREVELSVRRTVLRGLEIGVDVRKRVAVLARD